MSEDKYISDNYPYLSKIDTPADLRNLPVEELPKVCDELRRFIIDNVSQHPGHFASSMGAVDLTVALHYVFNTPYDRLVWDVGHQAYGHKILTGRRDVFHTLRSLNGISGFPNPKESEYDSFVAGHASNSISVALGMAVAADLEGENRNVVAVIGDASISGGLAFEGINNAASKNSNLIIILNDNDMAIDENVGSLGKYLTKLTTSKPYNDFRYKTYKFFVRHNIINEKGRGSILRFNNSLKSFISSQQNIFEGLNIRYFGPFDGHDVISLVAMLRNIKDMRGPRIVHLHTRKGKGYPVAEKDPTVWHAPGKFNPETGERIKSSQKPGTLKYQDVFGKTLVELAEQNPKIVGITAAMPTGCSMTFMQERFPTRAFDVGISEGHAVTFSAGMAKDGLVPYCCIYSTFLQRAYDNIIHDIALQKLPVVLCLDRAGLVGEDGATHHGVFDLAYLRPIPGMQIASPIDEHWLRNLLYTAQLDNYGPIAIRYPRGSGNRPDWHCEFSKVEIGKGQTLRRGTDVAVLSIGPIGQIAAKAINSLGVDAQKVGHYDMVWLKPIDGLIMSEVAMNYRKIITIEDGTKVGGLGSAVCDWLSEHHYQKHVIKIGVGDEFVAHGSVSEQYKQCGMDEESIRNTIIEALK